MRQDRRPKAATVTPHLIRRHVLEQSRRANVGHIGSALSVADIVAALYSDALSGIDPADPDRDRFVVSKGHAALAVFAALRLRGWIDQSDLDTYSADGTLLGVHPERELTGVDFCTGSLGHGLAIGAGASLAARLQGSSRRVFVLLSDAECNEGSVWESAAFAAHHRLAGLVALVDKNGQQALGHTPEVLEMNNLAERFAAFGWDAREIDGTDAGAVARAIASLDTTAGPPHVLVANTVFGRGVSFMEGQVAWHYLPMGQAEYEQALREIEELA